MLQVKHLMKDKVELSYSGKNKGAIEVYIERESQKLLGAELFTEATEHMAHLLSWIIGEELTLNDILEKPFIIQH